MSPEQAQPATRTTASPRIARALSVVGALAAVSAVLVLSTGGFRAELRALRLSMRSPWPSVVLCLGAAIMSLLLDAGRAPAPSPSPSPPGHAEGRPWLDVAWTGAPATGTRVPEPGWLVVDADEEPAFRRRFASVSELGRLDWPPSASTDPPSAVRIYRLEDRARYLAGEPARTERIPPVAVR